ncbi:MAG: YciI family protein [Alphaproteobacteria bacterium]|jgi:uncharacterized protein YciI
MLFVLTCIDKPHAGALRMEIRPRHLAYIDANRAAVKLAGPFLSDDGQAMTGSLIVLEVENLAAAQAFAAADPYALGGLFASVDIRAWRCTIGAIAP